MSLTTTVFFLVGMLLLSGKLLEACDMTEVCQRCECLENNSAVTCRQLYLQGKSFLPLVCQNVTKLNIFESDIVEINDSDIAHLVHLKVFKITNTPLEKISEHAFASLKNLETLLVQNTSLTELLPYTFSNLVNLREITIAESSIANITLEHFSSLTGALQKIKLSGNKLADISGGFFNTSNSLLHLDLSHNDLTGLDNTTLRCLSQVTDVTFEYNYLGQIASDAFDDMTSLVTLNLANNKLDGFTGDTFLNSSIMTLNISDNVFTFIPIMPISKMDKLQVLDMDGNSIVEITEKAFSSLFQLKELHLSHLNLLTKVHEGGFDTTASLEKIFLSHNPQLSEIHPNAFSAGLPTLKELYINNNGLTKIPGAMFNGTVLSSLNIVEAQGNPLLCSCDVIWMRNDMDDETIEWIQSWKDGEKAVTCTAPERFNGSKVYDIDIDSLTCDLPEILDMVQFLESNKENFFIEVLVSGGLPTTKWTTVSGVTLVNDDKHDPGTGNDIVSLHEKILANDTVMSRLLINHPTERSRGRYTFHASNAAGVIQHDYQAKPPNLPNKKLRKIGLIVGLVIGGVIIIALVGCLIHLVRKKPYKRMREETAEPDTSERPTYGSVDKLVNETESPPSNTEQA